MNTQKSIAEQVLAEWDQPLAPSESLKLPSRFQHADKVTFFLMPDDPSLESFPGIPAEVIAVHFYPGKIKYDLDLLFVDNQRSRIYNVDSVLVGDRNPEPKQQWVNVYGNSKAFREFLTDKGISWKPNEHFTLISTDPDLFELGQEWQKYKQEHTR